MKEIQESADYNNRGSLTPLLYTPSSSASSVIGGSVNALNAGIAQSQRREKNINPEKKKNLYEQEIDDSVVSDDAHSTDVSTPYYNPHLSFNSLPSSDTYVITMQKKQSELATAARNKDIEALRRHMRSYIESRDAAALDEMCALHWACYIGCIQLVECLIRLGCNVYNTDKLNLDTACHYAVKGAHFDVLVFLYKHAGSDILHQQNRTHMTPFLTASAEVSEERTTELLRIMEWMYLQGVSLEQQDDNGQTALFWASKRGSVHIVQWLLSKGCNMAHRDHMGHTILHAACMTNTTQQQDHQDTLLFLCEKGAINLVNAKSIENEKSVGNTVFRICLIRRHFLMYMSLWKWWLQYRFFGFVRLFRSAYSWYYWFLTLANLALFINMSVNLTRLDSAYDGICSVWIIVWVVTQICWFIAFASDPGFAIKGAIPDHFHRLSPDFAKDVDSSPVYPAPKGSALWNLQRLEREQLLLNQSLIELNQQCYKKNISVNEDKQYNQILDKMFFIRNEIIKYMPLISNERIQMYPTAYVSAVLINQPSIKTVCVTCKIVKPPRVHHCADCAHCIKREDHHCVWIDNCVALRNQRSFWCFLLCLTFSILCNFAVTQLFFHHFLYQPRQFLCICLAFIFGVLLNTMWLCFVLYLLARTTKAMITNVTFYEYLKKPEHIRRRFKDRVEGLCWDLSDISPVRLCRNIWGFWSLNSSLDDEYALNAAASPPTSQNMRINFQQNAHNSGVNKHMYMPVSTSNKAQPLYQPTSTHTSSSSSFLLSPSTELQEYRKYFSSSPSSASAANSYFASYVPLPQS